MSNQVVVVVLNPFHKLASIRRVGAGTYGEVSLDAYYKNAFNCEEKQFDRVVFKALRKHSRSEWCQSIVSRNLTVDQANDIIRHLNRGYLAQGYKLLQNEKLV